MDHDMQSALQKSLEKNGFNFWFAPDGNTAKELVLSLIPEKSVVGVGGSMTIREMDLPESLRQRGDTVYDHWQSGLAAESRFHVAKKQISADYFLTSTNALTMDGKLVNTDNTGNRVSAMIIGPERVIVVAGKNKVVQNVEQGLQRIKEVAAPRNCQRRNDKTPCAQELVCNDCDSQDRLCRVTTIIEKKTRGIQELDIILVDEELGY